MSDQTGARNAGSGARDDKEARLSAALRDNLRRRKAARKKKSASPDASGQNSASSEE